MDKNEYFKTPVWAEDKPELLKKPEKEIKKLLKFIKILEHHTIPLP